VIAVDTNILVYAHRKDSPWHARASEAVTGLAEGRARWALPWPCLHEFFAVVTHPRIYAPPSSIAAAVAQIDAWLESPSAELIAEDVGYWAILKETLDSRKVAGPRVHDARIASLCALHGVRELWSADRDFTRFPDLRTKNPLQDI
jgi:toxin-antitoxin system PIN domain toxin